MLIKSDAHPVGGTIRWRIQYGRWIENTAYILGTSTVVSDDTNYVVSGLTVEGKDLVFLVAGGALNLAVTLTVTMRDSLGNVLPDTINLIGVDP
jgi:hypothetical protein